MSDKEKSKRHKQSTSKRDTPIPASRTQNISASDATRTSHQEKKNAEKEVQLLLTALECSLVSLS